MAVNPFHPAPFNELSTDVPDARELYRHSVFILEHMREFFPGSNNAIGNSVLETIKLLEFSLDAIAPLNIK